MVDCKSENVVYLACVAYGSKLSSYELIKKWVYIKNSRKENYKVRQLELPNKYKE